MQVLDLFRCIIVEEKLITLDYFGYDICLDLKSQVKS